jgi:zinc protease
MQQPIISTSLSEFKFPPYRNIILKGGAMLFVLPDYNQEIVNISVLSRQGATTESIEGLASMTTQMLHLGTTSRSATEVAEEVDMLGASLSIKSQWELSGLSISGLKDSASAMLEIISDCILNPLFLESEFERIRKNAISDLMFELNDPNFLATRAYTRTMFDGHPYSRQRIGTVESLMQIRVEDCVAYYNQLRTSSSWMMIVSGNVQDGLLEDISATFDGLQSVAKTKAVQNWQPTFGRKVAFVDLPSAQQTNLIVGQLAPEFGHPDYAGIQVLNTILGGYFLARINAILREEKGYTYGVYSGYEIRYEACELSISGAVSAENTQESIEIILREWERLHSEPIGWDELQQCKQFLTGSFARSTETPSQLSALTRNVAEYDRKPEFHEEFIKTINELTPETLFRIQQEHIKPDSLIISACGRKEVLLPQLTPFGNPVEHKFHIPSEQAVGGLSDSN